MELTRELCVAQEELKQASRGVGPLLDDAKLLQQTVQVTGEIYSQSVLCLSGIDIFFS